MPDPVAVISLLVWDSPRYTGNLLSNLDWAPPGGRFHLRILDQGSEPETRYLVRRFVETHPACSAELLPANIGYGAGHNRNYAQMRAQLDFDYFVTINSDLLFGAPGWLKTLVGALAADPGAALAGPYCYRQTATHMVPASRTECQVGDWAFVTGAVCAIRARAVDELGLFDETFSPAYFEDADMALRYQHFGWRQLWTDVPALHGYLGDAERVNEAKRAALDAQWGEFRHRNMLTYARRWRAGDAAKPTTPAALRGPDYRIYFPPAPASTETAEA